MAADIGPRIGPVVGPRIEVGPSIGASLDFVDAISLTEDEMAESLRRLETSATFADLRSLGVIVPLIPRYAWSVRQSETQIVDEKSPRTSSCDEHLSFLESFVFRKGISRDQFDQFLRGQVPPSKIASLCRCSANEAALFAEAIRTFQIFTNYAAEIEQRSPVQPPMGATGDQLLLKIIVMRGIIADVIFADNMRSCRYLVRKDLLRKEPSLRNSAEVQHLLDSLRLVNDTLSVRFEVARELLQCQEPYIATGDILRLRCLSQAQLAKKLHKHPSTLLRAIRGRNILIVRDNNEEVMKLEQLCSRKLTALIIRALVKRQPDISDREIQRTLCSGYGARITRRTVNYHRHQFQKRRDRT